MKTNQYSPGDFVQRCGAELLSKPSAGLLDATLPVIGVVVSGNKIVVPNYWLSASVKAEIILALHDAAMLGLNPALASEFFWTCPLDELKDALRVTDATSRQNGE